MILSNILAIVFLILWIVSIFVFHREKMSFLKFIVGTIGGFVFMLYFGKLFLNESVTLINLNIMHFLTAWSQNIEVFVESNAVTIYSGTNVLSYFITYECSGLIEMLVFTNILMFYPIFTKNLFKKLSIVVLGNAFIVIANILRLFLMSYIVIIFGVESFFLAHVVFARIFFIGFNILLYYLVFTLPHIKLQKAGDYVLVNNK